jgi:hypothetical protein
MSWQGKRPEKCDCICGCNNDAKPDDAVCGACWNGNCAN